MIVARTGTGLSLRSRKECSYDTRPSYGDERREGLHNHTGRPPDIQRERLELQEIERGACLGREDNMKMTHLRLAVLGAAIMVWPVTIMAGDFKTPVAPEEVLKMPNPIPPTAEIVKEVPGVYESKCSKCHGDKGDGKGSATKGLDVKPRNYRDKNVMERIPDGQLFWIIANGSDPEATEMSGYKKKLSEEQMWALVHYIRRFTQ
jgi:mono/diheme cytochrome c family protein